MNQQTRTDPAAVSPRPAGDMGRRLASRREHLGLTREQVADRAGMATPYLEYLEQQPTAVPSAVLLLGLADALQTTVSELRGGSTNLPPGLQKAARHPELAEMTPEECRARLSTHGVGRVAVTGHDGPAIIPVNYQMVDGSLVFRTSAESAPALSIGTRVAFEVDHIDEALSQGWSVLVVGSSEHVTDPDTVQDLIQRAHSGPWAGGDRALWVRIGPDRITGRRIHVR
ncbi:helix-turn-helix domain-containing protein [Streptomyces sp. H39-S7]|uniref:helix-turn-helix domain-containing protein n=1 Tax=Streptomyces sp. H39-S7 TaxID=3004357 RepID=UPI0022B008A8|nr:pyridoxamine 5'-phosphate oxidase family protein [Streptomyces sp. H39-S7]MCZ4125915.1 pyridoxamine 5'-phosphate oxidase family protein [Streptomyces sp. H39-S7]